MKRLKLPEEVSAGDVVEVQIAPLGAFLQEVDNPSAPGKRRTVTQVVDEEAARRLVAAMDGDVLVDMDHSSEGGGSSEAAAWIKALRLDPDRGLVADFEFTDRGAEAVSARRYRFVSPAWTLGEDGRPARLVSVALTNRPNIPVAPVLNMRAVAAAEAAAVPPEREAAGDDGGGEAVAGKESMDKIREALGLAPDAPEGDVVAAVEALKAKVAEMQSEKEEAKAAEFAERNKDVVANAEELKEQYLKDPEATEKVVANCRRMMEAVVKNHKAEIAQAQASRPKVVVNSRQAAEPRLGSPAAEGLAKCGTPEERMKFIMQHRSEM